jgi:cytochrome c-type biogenesis protein CcmH/NrfG
LQRGVISYYRKALELDPECQEAWGALGFALIREPATRTEGLDALERAIALDPTDGLSHLSAGLGYWLSNDAAMAQYHYSKAAELRPTDSQALAYYEQHRRRTRKEVRDGNGASPGANG